MLYSYSFIFDTVLFDRSDIFSSQINKIKPRSCTL